MRPDRKLGLKAVLPVQRRDIHRGGAGSLRISPRPCFLLRSPAPLSPPEAAALPSAAHIFRCRQAVPEANLFSSAVVSVTKASPASNKPNIT